jgi:glucose-1-phosphatase
MLFIFDMGNVVSTSVDILPDLSVRLDIPIEELRRVCADDFFGLTTGAISTGTFWETFRDRFGMAPEEEYLATLFNPRLDYEVTRVLESIRHQGLRLVCGTNTIESHYRVHQERGDYGFFDHVYASHLMGTAKPDSRFYRVILEAEGYSKAPERALFVDDLEQNVAAARGAGLAAHRFTGVEPLCRFLGRYGIECQAGGVSVSSAGSVI